MRKKYQNEYFNRVTKILKMSLNIRNTIQGINTFVVPSYGYQVLDWSIPELEDIDQQKRSVLRKHHMRDENSDVHRLYVSSPSGGRGVSNITDLYKTQMTSITYSQYLQRSTEKLMTSIRTKRLNQKSQHHQRKENARSIFRNHRQATNWYRLAFQALF